jgi:uncharacterized membrane protein
MNKSLLHSIRNAFLSGLLVLAPLAVTIWVFTRILVVIGGTFSPLLFPYVPSTLRNDQFLSIVWNVLATLIVLVLITALGYLSRYVLGQYFGGLAERFIQSIPGVNTVYNTVKQIVDTFSSQHRSLFSKVVMVEFPRPGCFTVGFLTNRTKGELQARVPGDRWSVFVPTTPNPTSGFLLLLPRDQITELDMSVGEGMKLIISGGTIIPPWPAGGSRAPTATENPPPVSGAGHD